MSEDPARTERAHPDKWLRDVTPSADLRHWHHHDQERFAEFGDRCIGGLEDADHRPAVQHLRDLPPIAKPLIPPSKARPQGGGTQDTPDETLFAAIIYVLVSGCAWRALPPCFGISKSTAHRRFLIWSRAGVWGRSHEALLHRLDDAGLVDVTRIVLSHGTSVSMRHDWQAASRELSWWLHA